VFAGATLVSSACFIEAPPPRQPPPPQFAQPPGAGPAAQGSSSVSGMLVDGDSRQPLPNRTVSLRGDPLKAMTGRDTITTTSDDRGVFTFRGIPTGDYALTSGQDAARVRVVAGQDAQVELAVYPPRPPPADHMIPKPYGAPPARRRLT
jgi:hypothetical protein